MSAAPLHLHMPCPFCDAQMSVHREHLPGHCGQPACALAHARYRHAKRQAEKDAEYATRTEIAKTQFAKVRDTLPGAPDIAPDRVHVAPVPHAPGPVAHLPQDRRDSYLAHLRAITQASFARPVQDLPAPTRDPQAEDEVFRPWEATACGACQGRCCQKWGGDENAFQTVELIDDLRRRQPDLTAEDVLAFYEEALPDTASEGGCVFQGPEGCVLDRGHRADICNSYRCDALGRLFDALQTNASDAIAMVSVYERTPGRTGFHLLDQTCRDRATEPGES